MSFNKKHVCPMPKGIKRADRHEAALLSCMYGTGAGTITPPRAKASSQTAGLHTSNAQFASLGERDAREWHLYELLFNDSLFFLGLDYSIIRIHPSHALWASTRMDKVGRARVFGPLLAIEYDKAS